MKRFLTILTAFVFIFFSGIGIVSANEDDAAIDLTKADAFDDNYQQTNLAAGYNLSPAEKMFNSEEAAKTGQVLRQIGYGIFSPRHLTGGNATGKYDNNYKLSIGESVNIYLYGDSIDVMAISGTSVLSPVIKTEVDSKGNIFVQGIGMVPAENKTLSQVESSLQRLASSKYKSLRVKLNVASNNSGFSVFVYGAVNIPGKILIGNNSSIVDALSAAGGVRKTGSLRNIIYSSGSNVKNIDLYQTLFSAKGDDIIVRPNDKIFVAPLGDIAALDNGVAMPGIYEIKNGETLEQVIKYAGGLLPGTQKTDVVLTGLDKETMQRTAENIDWAIAKNTKLKSGDAVKFKELYNTAENTVTIQGNIKHPATYAYKEGMKLSDILKGEDELLEETFITQAVIRRVSGKDNTVQTLPIFLKEFFAGINDPELQPRDIINVYKNTNAEFVDVYGCIDTPKHITYKPNMTLGEILSDVQFVEYNIEEKDSSEIPAAFEQTEEKPELSADIVSNNKKIPAGNVAVEITSANGDSKLYYLYDIMVNADSIRTIILNPSDKVFFRQLRDNESIKNVKVSGFVNHPGVFKFVEGKTLKDMIELAGGLTPQANLQGIRFIRKNIQNQQIVIARKNQERDIKTLEGKIAGAYMQTKNDMESKTNVLNRLEEEENSLNTRYTGQIALNIDTNDINKISETDNIEIQDGDEIYIPRLSTHVSVIGEVYNEQSFIYKKGATVKSYIKEVGGYTPNANKFRIYKVGTNGRAEKVHNWTVVEAGDTIVVPRKIAGNDWFSPLVGALQSIANLAIMSVAVTKW